MMSILRDPIVMLSLLEISPKSIILQSLMPGSEDIVKTVTNFWFPVATAQSG